MIHSILIALDRALPFFPPLAIILTTTPIALIALSLYGRGKGTILFCVATGVLALGLAAGLVTIDHPSVSAGWGPVENLAEDLIGPASFRAGEQFTAAGVIIAGILLALAYAKAFKEKPGERPRRILERDEEQGKILGSAHLTTQQTFRRWSRPDPAGWTLHGQFWGARGQPLGTRLHLSGEDIARGIAVFGPQGSGKTQCLILPAIADRMQSRHSLIVTDVQGELQPAIEHIAGVTGHLVVAHNPSDPEHSCAVNLCDMVHTVIDAQAMATVLMSKAHGGSGDQFWVQAAINLLAACILHYGIFGDIIIARRDLKKMAEDMANSDRPGVADLAADFVSSMQTRDPKLALNIMAEMFNIGLKPWAEPGLRDLTSHSDLDIAGQLTTTPTVLVLRCSGAHTDVYGTYLGTTLRVLTTRLDHIAERSPGGRLEIPVGLILEEFPALGRLDSLVRDINLIRKRRISVLTAAQSLSQFDHVYPERGEADRLMAGLATKVVFGGCDQRTSTFFSQLSGQQTVALASISRTAQRPGTTFHDNSSAHLQGRPLLLPDDIIRPARGHATLFAAYSAGNRAEQAIFHGNLTPFWKRRDWQQQFTRTRPAQAIGRSNVQIRAPRLEHQPEPPEPGQQDRPTPELEVGGHW